MMWNDYEKIARRLDRIAKAFERIANALETANIIEADRKTEPSICDGCKFYDGEDCYLQGFCKFKTEPQTEQPTAQEYEKWLFKEPQTDCSWK